MSSLQPIQNCRSNGTNQHSWTASDGTRYEWCYNWKGPNGSEGSGNAVGRNSDGTCNYPQKATHAYCVPTASNTTCPDGFRSENGVCKGRAYGIADEKGDLDNGSHGFSGYSNTRKAQWACNAGEGVTWEAVLRNKPSGKTWWIGDENGGYCTNNKADIIKYGKCDRYGHVLHSDKDPNRWVCAFPTVNANPYEFGPGTDEALYAQVMQNANFEMNGCWQHNDNPGGSWGGNRGKCKPLFNNYIECYFPEYRCTRTGDYVFGSTGDAGGKQITKREGEWFPVKHEKSAWIEDSSISNFIGTKESFRAGGNEKKGPHSDRIFYYGGSYKTGKHTPDGITLLG